MFITTVLSFMLMALPVRDDGQYAQSPLKSWVESLTDQLGVRCCGDADGSEVEGWAFGSQGYRIRIKGRWYDVPPTAVVQVPNKLGYARAWIFWDGYDWKVRCFLPGAGI